MEIISILEIKRKVMRFEFKADFALLAKMSIAFLLLINSIKFFTFLIDSSSYGYASFAIYNRNISSKLYESIIIRYGQMLYNLNAVYLTTFFIFLLVTIFSLKMSKQLTLNYFLIIILLISIAKIDLIKFNTPKFYGIVPISVCSNLKSYLLINGVIFILLAVVVYFLAFKKYFYDFWSNLKMKS